MIGIGVDMVEVSRIADAYARSGERFSRRILNNDELAEFDQSANPENFLAKRFAAKEAVAKALGSGFSQGVSWTDISLAHDQLGRPLVNLSGGAKKRLQELGGTTALISLSDEAGFVIAYAQVG
jgi:holo-[acyl-carrier protein] synthase